MSSGKRPEVSDVISQMTCDIRSQWVRPKVAETVGVYKVTSRATFAGPPVPAGPSALGGHADEVTGHVQFYK